VTDETKRPANLTPEASSDTGLGHRGDATALLQLHQKIDRSYKIEVGRCAYNVAR